MMVRRFREQLDRSTHKYTLVELPPDWISAEREAAEKHEYRESFRETFARSPVTSVLRAYELNARRPVQASP
jgi:hypothetical protein